jgi:hypothetical protein
MKPSVSVAARKGHLAMVLVDGCAFVLFAAAGLHQDCTWSNVMTLVGI